MICVNGLVIKQGSEGFIVPSSTTTNHVKSAMTATTCQSSAKKNTMVHTLKHNSIPAISPAARLAAWQMEEDNEAEASEQVCETDGARAMRVTSHYERFIRISQLIMCLRTFHEK